jgi:hypothetical protein
MDGKIPQPIRLEVIRRWLRGYSRDEIARDAEIGAGTVSGIIKQCRQDDADFDLLRGVALELRDRGMRVENLAPMLRLKSLLEEKEVALDVPKNGNLLAEYKKFESIIITLDALCFKRGMSMDQFSQCVFSFYSQIDNLGISVERLPEYLEDQRKEIHWIKSETKNAVEQQGATMNLLREYQANMPAFKQAMNELPKVIKERDSCLEHLEYVRKQYEQKVWDQKGDEYGWYADPEEMNKTTTEIGSELGGDHYVSRLRKPGLKKILQDLYRYPSKYVEPIRKIIEIYDSLHGHGA